MRRLLLGGVALLLAACGGGTAVPTAEEIAATSAEINAWFDAKYEEQLLASPIALTFQGRKEHYDKIDQFGDAELDRQLAWMRASVVEMKDRFDPARLDEEARTSFDLWAHQLDLMEKGAQFRRAPYVFVKDGPHVFLPSFIISFHAVADKADMEAYVARLRELGRGLDQVLDVARLAAAEGNHAPRFAYDQAMEESRNVIRGAPFEAGADSPLWADAKSEISALLTAGAITAEEAATLEADARAALMDSVKPAYDRVIAWLEADRASTPELAQGAGTLMKDGAAFYNMSLEQMTTTTMTADEIHDLGLREVARIKGEMEAIKDQVGFQGSLQDFFVFIRTDPQFHLPDSDEGRATYIKMAEDYLADIESKLPEFFGLMPKAPLVVRRVEAFREEAGGAQHYYPPTPDGSRPGIFYAHLSDMNAMPTYELETITYHEGNPGHHMQIAIAQELTGIPKFRTQYGSTAFQEGWALYTETLAKEMGQYADPYSDYGRLSAEIWRAIRLVVDTGIHAKGWSEEEAVQYFLDNSSVPEAAVRSEIRRYIVWPAQATAYKIGMIKIQELRAKAQQELGAKFTMAGFHDTILGGGAMPLPVLEARVNRWIEATKRS